MPDWLWRLNVAGMQRFFNFTTVGLFDPAVRELMGYSWSPRQERLHRLFGKAVYWTTKLLPKRMLMHPRKRSAIDRATGRLPADSPLVETPARNLPPVEYRGDGKHYCPADAV
jgi:uncharacterized protein (DUF2236 family)